MSEIDAAHHNNRMRLRREQDEIDRERVKQEAKVKADKIALKWRQMPIACQDYLALALNAGPEGIKPV
jgi:hypothetical protein